MSEASDDEMAIVARYYEALNTADELGLRDMLDPGFVLRAGGRRLGLDAYIATLAEYRTGFPDLTVRVVRRLGDGPWIAVCTVTSGILIGPFLEHAPTYRAFSAAGADFLRTDGIRILEIESHFDTIGMLAQLGLYKAGRR